MALTVTISGGANIDQRQQVTLRATVQDSGGNTPPGTLQYAWSASRGSFDGATDEASAVYEADFTDPDDVEVTITCEVTRPAEASPTISAASLTAMTELGITGQILNMFITETEDSANGRNKVIYAAGSDDSTLDPGSDDDVTDSINTWRVQYHVGEDWFILNNDGSGDLGAFFQSNTTQSVYLIFSDGSYFEITNARYDAGASSWVRWDVTNVSGLATKLDDLGADETLLIGVGDAGSIGWAEDTGSDTETFTAAAVVQPPPPPTPPTFTAPASVYEVNERADDTIDSTEFFTGHTSLSPKSGTTLPSWITISGLDVVITGAPDVLEDTDVTVELTASNSGGSEDGDITISVKQIDPAPVIGTLSRIDINEGESRNEDLSRDLQNTDTLVITSGPSWVRVSGLGLQITDAAAVNSDTDFTVNLRAESDATRETDTGSVVIRVLDVPTLIRPSTALAPQSVEVSFPSATTALIKWSGAADHATLTGYEVNATEGATLGTIWTKSPDGTRRRTLVKGLKRSTQYTFAVRGVNAAGSGAASTSVTGRTPIASLHNALFFKECVNYFEQGARVSEHGNPSNIIRAVGDNNYKTASTVKDYAINIAVNGQPTRVDAFAVKGKRITRHSGTPMGGRGSGWTDVDLPATVKNWEGTEVSTTVAGFQHHLYLLPEHFTATSVRVQFEGTGVEVYEILLLEFGIEIDANGDFLDIQPNFVDREGVVQPDPGGGIVYDSPIGADDRDKWEVDFTARVLPNKTLLQTPEEFLYWQAENRNHVFAMEPSRFPWRVFPAAFVRKSVPVRYRTDDKTGTQILTFRVAEQ